VPAIALVCLQDLPRRGGLRLPARSGLAEGAASGIGFAVIFIGIDRAGSRMSNWPLMSGLVLASLSITPLLWRAPLRSTPTRPERRG